MAGAASALFIHDIKGRVLVWCDYHDDVLAVQAERFFTKFIEKENSQADPDSRIALSSESIQYGIGILQAIQNESKSLKKSLKDVAAGNEFEKKLLGEVIPPSDIGVTFDDIGALENVNDTLKELMMLPLQRPELFYKGQLSKVDYIFLSLNGNAGASVERSFGYKK